MAPATTCHRAGAAAAAAQCKTGHSRVLHELPMAPVALSCAGVVYAAGLCILGCEQLREGLTACGQTQEVITGRFPRHTQQYPARSRVEANTCVHTPQEERALAAIGGTGAPSTLAPDSTASSKTSEPRTGNIANSSKQCVENGPDHMRSTAWLAAASDFCSKLSSCRFPSFSEYVKTSKLRDSQPNCSG